MFLFTTARSTVLSQLFFSFLLGKASPHFVAVEIFASLDVSPFTPPSIALVLVLHVCLLLQLSSFSASMPIANISVTRSLVAYFVYISDFRSGPPCVTSGIYQKVLLWKTTISPLPPKKYFFPSPTVRIPSEAAILAFVFPPTGGQSHSGSRSADISRSVLVFMKTELFGYNRHK